MRFLSAAFLLSSCLSFNAYCETLSQAFTGAYQTQALLQARHKVMGEHETSVQDRAQFRPTIRATLSSKRGRTLNDTENTPVSGSDIGKSYQTTHQGSVEVSQNLFKGGGHMEKISMTDHKIMAQWADLRATEQKVFSQVAELYCTILGKIKEIEFIKSNIKFLTKQYESTNDKFKAGEETITNVSSAEADLAGGHAQLQTAKAELQGLKAQYKSLVGTSPETFEKPTIPTFLPKTLEQALDYGRIHHPRIVMEIHNVKAASHGKGVARSGLLPSIDVSASATRSETNGDSYLRNANNGSPSITNSTTNSAQIQMSVPLYQGGSVRSQIRQAHQNSEAARVGLQKTRLEIDAEIINRYQTFIASRENLKNYQKQVEARALIVKSTQQEKEAGSKTLVDVLKAQRDLLEAQKRFVDSEKNYYVTAYAFASAVGMLNAENLKLPVDMFSPQAHFQSTKWKF